MIHINYINLFKFPKDDDQYTYDFCLDNENSALSYSVGGEDFTTCYVRDLTNWILLWEKQSNSLIYVDTDVTKNGEACCLLKMINDKKECNFYYSLKDGNIISECHEKIEVLVDENTFVKNYKTINYDESIILDDFTSKIPFDLKIRAPKLFGQKVLYHSFCYKRACYYDLEKKEVITLEGPNSNKNKLYTYIDNLSDGTIICSESQRPGIKNTQNVYLYTTNNKFIPLSHPFEECADFCILNQSLEEEYFDLAWLSNSQRVVLQRVDGNAKVSLEVKGELPIKAWTSRQLRVGGQILKNYYTAALEGHPITLNIHRESLSITFCRKAKLFCIEKSFPESNFFIGQEKGYNSPYFLGYLSESDNIPQGIQLLKEKINNEQMTPPQKTLKVNGKPLPEIKEIHHSHTKQTLPITAINDYISENDLQIKSSHKLSNKANAYVCIYEEVNGVPDTLIFHSEDRVLNHIFYPEETVVQLSESISHLYQNKFFLGNFIDINGESLHGLCGIDINNGKMYSIYTSENECAITSFDVSNDGRYIIFTEVISNDVIQSKILDSDSQKVYDLTNDMKDIELYSLKWNSSGEVIMLHEDESEEVLKLDLDKMVLSK